ncbi:MAG: YgiQ family radical SAM protein [Desulfobulbaceae bacterium]|nr:YgiQ family radical SAM protein [Desulfobulbaceae bacterium]
MFLPTTEKEVRQLGWGGLDIILVTGDAYIDSPFIGVAVLGKVLLDAGYRVGIIAQPETGSDVDIARLGEPELFWGVTGGCIDSMVANRTASGKKRKSDDYTPGGVNCRRPDRAVLVYTNLIRQYFKKTRPIILGGLEASLRRIAHYDFWANRIRKSILFDAKADYLLYGMADKSVLELAAALKNGTDVHDIRGLCYASIEIPEDALLLPPFEAVSTDRNLFAQMFQDFYRHNDPLTAKTLVQQQDSRFLVQNPPPLCLTTEELDRVHSLDFERELHPYYRQQGNVRALETIRFAIATHRGCYGECNFCAIAVHQGRIVRWRSRKSIVQEAEKITRHPLFKGTIHDVGGPTANMYGFECEKKLRKGSCTDKRCLYPKVCPSMRIDHGEQIKLLRELRQVKHVRKVIVASGIRYDMILADTKHGTAYLRDLVRHHISGQLKIAPEHSEEHVLALMGKPGRDELLRFRDLFTTMTRREGLNQFLTYYMIAAHPGCTLQDMQQLRMFCSRHLKLLPRQIQIFTPTPSTYSTLMYWTELDIYTGKACFVEKTAAGRDSQKRVLTPSVRPGKKRS